MPRPPRSAVLAFSRRAALAAFAAGVLRALVAGAVAGAVLLLGARAFGLYFAPHPLWAVALLPVVVAGLLQARRERLGEAAAAAHLDRRLGASGLLLSAHEGRELDGPQRDRLAAVLAALPAALPRPRWRALLPWPAAALALLAAVALLPPPSLPSAARPVAALTSEVERLGERLRDLLERGDVPDETRHELERQLQQAREQLAAGQAPEWRELDALDRRLDREALLQAAGGAPDGGAPAGEDPASAAPGAEMVAAAAEALAAAGRLDELGAGLGDELRAALAAAQRGDGTFAPDALPQDPAALRALAEAMAAAARLPGVLEQVQQLDGEKLADLRAVLAQFEGTGAGHGDGGGEVAGQGDGIGAGTGEGDGEGEGEGKSGERPGRGGVTRGPGHVALRMTEDAPGGVEAVMPLPPGVPLPTEWVPIASRRREPTVDPTVNRAAGGAGASGSGGATWQLDLAPRHRAVVRRYFDAGEKR